MNRIKIRFPRPALNAEERATLREILTTFFTTSFGTVAALLALAVWMGA